MTKECLADIRAEGVEMLRPGDGLPLLDVQVPDDELLPFRLPCERVLIEMMGDRYGKI
jgi:hypothetical protein